MIYEKYMFLYFTCLNALSGLRNGQHMRVFRCWMVECLVELSWSLGLGRWMSQFLGADRE